MKRASLLLPGLFALGACTPQTTILPSRDLERPTDMTFVCMGAFDTSGNGDFVLSGRPMRHCHPRNALDPAPDDQHRSFAFVPNSANGQLTVIDADRWKLVDLDLSIAGFNQFPLGRLPTQITASDDGCRVVTANHGSCDLSLVDPAALLQPTLARGIPNGTPPIPGLPPAAPGSIVTRVVPRTPVPLIAQEIAFLPQDTAALTDGNQLCGDAWTRQAIVTFPSCNLIALMNLPSGEIVDGVYVRRTKDGRVVPEPLAGRAPQCPVADCTPPKAGGGSAPDGGADATVDADAGAAAAEGGADAMIDADVGAGDDAGAEGGVEGGAANDAGAPAAPAVLDPALVHPGPIAILPEGRRVYVGLTDAPFIVALEVDRDHLTVPNHASQGIIDLHDGAVGSSRLRLSVDPYTDKTTGGPLFAGAFVGTAKHPDRQYLYAIARDGSVRVVHATELSDTEQECETNVDPLLLPAAESEALQESACLTVEKYRAARRPNAQGPGLRFPTPPIDIAVADVGSKPEDHSQTSIAGAHAWVLTSNGLTYFINIEPMTRLTGFVEGDGTAHACETPVADQCEAEKAPSPNTPRNRNVMSFSRTLDPSEGPQRLDTEPTGPTNGPRIESIWTRGTADNATSDPTVAGKAKYIETQVFFPDPPAAAAQAWTVTWEGALAAPRVSGNIVPEGAGMALYDPGMDFCRLGMREGDIMSLGGCTEDAQCGVDRICQRGTEGALAAGGLPITGLCVHKSQKVEACSGLVSTVRRYEVTKLTPDRFAFIPRKDELVRPDLKRCVLDKRTPSSDGGAGTGGDGGAAPEAGADGPSEAGTEGGGSGSSAPLKDDCVNDLDPSTDHFQCLSVPTVVDGKATSENRCLMPCKVPGESTGCRAGRTCVSFAKVEDTVDTGTGSKPCGKNDNECFCADGPDLAKGESLMKCFGELLAYQVYAGRSFLVTGSQAAAPVTRSATGGHCEDIRGLDARLANRIPMNAPTCTNTLPNAAELDSRCNPDAPTAVCPAEDAVQAAIDLPKLAKTYGSTNPCLFNGGPNESDPAAQTPGHVHALFRNSEVQFMMTNLEQSPGGAFQIRFEVHGGFRPQSVTIPPTVEVGMPARILLGPFEQPPPPDTMTFTEVPYLFVVDQRTFGRTQSGGATRGQVLRINPRGAAITNPTPGAQPWFEDTAKSGDKFPIR